LRARGDRLCQPGTRRFRDGEDPVMLQSPPDESATLHVSAIDDSTERLRRAFILRGADGSRASFLKSRQI